MVVDVIVVLKMVPSIADWYLLDCTTGIVATELRCDGCRG
jgi:hypothetical protein